MAANENENIVCRYQDMLEDGWTPHSTTKHHPDVYAWNQTAIQPLTHYHELRSATYFTSVVGTDEVVQGIERALRALPHHESAGRRMMIDRRTDIKRFKIIRRYVADEKTPRLLGGACEAAVRKPLLAAGCLR